VRKQFRISHGFEFCFFKFLWYRYSAAAQAARAGEKGFNLAAALDALPTGNLPNLEFVEVGGCTSLIQF
jgi:hypothetical protein